MKGNLSRIVLGLVALGGISCQTLELETPKGVGEPTPLGNPDSHAVHLPQLTAPIAVASRGVSEVAIAGSRTLQVADFLTAGIFTSGKGASYNGGGGGIGSFDFSGCSVGSGGGFSCGGGH